MTWSDVVIFGPDRVARFRNAYGLVVVREPKTRRLAAHAAAQHVPIEDETLTRFLGACKSCLCKNNHEQRIWAGTPQAFSFRWTKIVRKFNKWGLCVHFTVGGLRGGGATEHFLKHQNVPLLMRRGRWTQLNTLDRYLRGGVAALFTDDDSLAREQIRMLALLASRFISEYDDDDDISLSHL